MKSTVLWALVALNALLLAGLVSQLVGPNTAMAQGGRHADYIMIPGSVIGGNNDVVWIVDTTNRQLSATALDGRQFVSMGGTIPLDRIFENDRGAGGAAGHGRGGRAGGRGAARD